jgi:hypothetical protein
MPRILPFLYDSSPPKDGETSQKGKNREIKVNLALELWPLKVAFGIQTEVAVIGGEWNGLGKSG